MGFLLMFLFIVYVDDLLKYYCQMQLNCYLGEQFAGAFTYVDDFILISEGLKKLEL